MENSKLTELWDLYKSDNYFNYQSIKSFLDSHGEKVNYDKGTYVIEQGDYPEYVYFIVDGIVVGKKIYKDGNEFSYFVADNRVGNIGLLEVLAHQKRYAATVECLTNVKMIKVPSHQIYQQIMEDPDLMQRCIALLSNDLYQVSNKEGRFYRLKSINRARLLFAESFENEQINGEVVIRKKQREIAADLGISIRSVDRVIKDLKASGEIDYRNRQIVINQDRYQQIMQNLMQEDV